MSKLTSQKSQRTRLIIAWLLVVVGLSGLIFSGFHYIHQKREIQQIETSAKSVDVKPAPSAVKPSAQAIASYSVAPDLPKYIAIPAINVGTTRIIQLGVLSNGQIDTPNNIFDTGWFDQSAKPGQPGAMFIYGHVSSWQANGIFYNLKNLKSGDKVIVTRGDNTVFTYQVVKTVIYPYNNVDMHTVLSPVNSGSQGLNLMTCTGQVIKGTSTFNERIVVFTTPVSN